MVDHLIIKNIEMPNKPNIAVSLNLDWPYLRYQELYLGIQNYADKHTNWHLVSDHFPEMKLAGSTPEAPFYDAIIGRLSARAYKQSKRLGIPVVNTKQSNGLCGLPCVFEDQGAEAKLAAEHLLQRGFRNFVNIEIRNAPSGKKYLSGLKSAIKAYKCPVQSYTISKNYTEDPQQWLNTCNAIRQWIKDWQAPLAICCSMNSVGLFVATECLENGVQIPEDIAIVVTGGDLSVCEIKPPHLTSIETDTLSIGYEAAQMLDQLMQGKTLEQDLLLIPPRGMTARQSTDFYAVDDQDVKLALRFIADNIHHNIQVNDIVEHVSVGRRSIEKRFRKIIGHSLTEEINRLRLISAKRLLLETDDNINKLYIQAGFSSDLHMIRVFNKNLGMTPGKYRAKNKL
jgi:LacI family transcriptional regulator